MFFLLLLLFFKAQVLLSGNDRVWTTSYVMDKMATSVLESSEDAFRKAFKLYKRRNPPPDFRNVTDFCSGAAGEKVRNTKESLTESNIN